MKKKREIKKKLSKKDGKQLPKFQPIILTREESEVEKEIKEAQDEIRDQEFHTFIRPVSGNTTPLLSSETTQQNRTNQDQTLEENVASAPGTTSTQTDIVEQTSQRDYIVNYNDVNYDTNYNDSELQRRQRNEALLVRAQSRTSIDPFTASSRASQDQALRVNPMLREHRGTVAQTSERDYIAKADRLEKSESGMPFEQNVRKYKGRNI